MWGCVAAVHGDLVNTYVLTLLIRKRNAFTAISKTMDLVLS